MKVIILNIVAMVLFIINASTASASVFGDYAVITANGNVKLKFSTVMSQLAKGNVCVKHRTSVKAKSPNLTKKHCQDKDFIERNNITVIKCAMIAENDKASACKGLPSIK